LLAVFGLHHATEEHGVEVFLEAKLAVKVAFTLALSCLIAEERRLIVDVNSH